MEIDNCPNCGSGMAVPFPKGLGGQACFSGVGVEQYEAGKYTVECGSCGHHTPVFPSENEAVSFWNADRPKPA